MPIVFRQIEKAGGTGARSALYAAANIILARSKGRKRALVAIARKLAVILHHMWIDGTPFSFTEPEAAS